jgi:hypothetical protein
MLVKAEIMTTTTDANADQAATQLHFGDLDRLAPAIADFARRRITATGLVLLGSLRSDGWPRISPVEAFELDGALLVGMMPDSMKARDLQRDPRCVVLTPLADKDDLSGETKLWCQAREETDGDEMRRVSAAFEQETGFDPGGPGDYHLFELHPVQGAWQRVEGDDWRTTSWRAGSPVRERTRSGPSGETRDL